MEESPVLEFWFDFGSPYSYLSAMRVEKEAAVVGVPVAWRAFLLGPVFKSLGWKSPPYLTQPQKAEYMWKDMERRTHKYGLGWTKPTDFPRRPLLPMRIAALHADKEWVGEFCRQVMQLNFVHDKDIDNAANLLPVLTALKLPAQALLDEAQSDEAKEALRHNTDQAFDKKIFGAPTFFVGDEMFWGDDRLEDALDYLLKL